MSAPLALRVSACFLLAAALAAPAPVGAQTVVDGPTLGVAEVLSFPDRSAEVPVAISVPEGLTPRTLSTTVQLPVDLERGHLEAWSGDLLLGREELGPDAESQRVTIPLDRGRVLNGVLDLTLRTVLHSRGEACPDWDDRPLELRDTEVDFAGEPEAPTVLADFVPPVLERLEIYLPDEPTFAESEAAAALALLASSRFGRTGLEIEVLPASGSRAPEASPFTRRAEIREADESRIDLTDDAVPTVEITGDSASLGRQMRSVTSDLWSLAVAGSATLDSSTPAPRALVTEATLDELGLGSRSARSVGSVTAGFGLDQTSLGQVTGDVAVDLVGSYSPPPSDRSGLLVASAGQTVLDSWTADPTGSFDRTVTVPAGALNRYTDITVSLQTSGAGAACGVLQPLTMIIDGSSRIRLSDPATPAPAGFGSLPQALLPRLQVATGSGSLEDTARAVAILAELQTLSATPLLPEWVSTDTLVEGDVPGLLVTSESVPSDLDLPLTLTGGRTLEVIGAREGQPATLRFYEDVDFASMQVVQDGDRALLVASTNSGSAELDRTLEWLDAEPGRWSMLAGNVLFTAPDREPVELSTAAAVDVDISQDEGTGGVRTALIIGLAVTLAGAAIAGIVWAVTRRRRVSPRR
ncbi:hypothetical protein H483_0108975 [Dietzia sp. UCD-THP]|uniref:hypothetical protein n=1 Tax=Dietzia sp. UCD-THP TaxID=1292020 RepID=UPI0003778A77|nr:hypothetical protein [Dietzia sp. UCD-THP]EYT62956.1 hypothetical protein H483_0108975 [Dietzia sp. UCD-THP]